MKPSYEPHYLWLNSVFTLCWWPCELFRTVFSAVSESLRLTTRHSGLRSATVDVTAMVASTVLTWLSFHDGRDYGEGRERGSLQARACQPLFVDTWLHQSTAIAERWVVGLYIFITPREKWVCIDLTCLSNTGTKKESSLPPIFTAAIKLVNIHLFYAE